MKRLRVMCVWGGWTSAYERFGRYERRHHKCDLGKVCIISLLDLRFSNIAERVRCL